MKNVQQINNNRWVEMWSRFNKNIKGTRQDYACQTVYGTRRVPDKRHPVHENKTDITIRLNLTIHINNNMMSTQILKAHRSHARPNRN